MAWIATDLKSKDGAILSVACWTDSNIAARSSRHPVSGRVKKSSSECQPFWLLRWIPGDCVRIAAISATNRRLSSLAPVIWKVNSGEGKSRFNLCKVVLAMWRSFSGSNNRHYDKAYFRLQRQPFAIDLVPPRDCQPRGPSTSRQRYFGRFSPDNLVAKTGAGAHPHRPRNDIHSRNPRQIDYASPWPKVNPIDQGWCPAAPVFVSSESIRT